MPGASEEAVVALPSRKAGIEVRRSLVIVFDMGWLIISICVIWLLVGYIVSTR